jgi:hypothetical protein
MDGGGGYSPRKVGWSMPSASDPKTKKETKPVAKSEGITLAPITVEGVAPTKRAQAMYGSGVPTGPSKLDDELFVHAMRADRHPDYRKNIMAGEDELQAQRAEWLAKEQAGERRALLNLQAQGKAGQMQDPKYLREHGYERAAEEREAALAEEASKAAAFAEAKVPEDGSRTRLIDVPTSDPSAKAAAERLGGPHTNEVADTLDATPAVSYKYKDAYFEPDTTKPGQRQAGFLTTDLKKTPLGEAVVEDRPDGYEGYNTHRMIGLQHAEIRNLHERMRELEEQLVSARGGRRG